MKIILEYYKYDDNNNHHYLGTISDHKLRLNTFNLLPIIFHIFHRIFPISMFPDILNL